MGWHRQRGRLESEASEALRVSERIKPVGWIQYDRAKEVRPKGHLDALHRNVVPLRARASVFHGDGLREAR